MRPLLRRDPLAQHLEAHLALAGAVAVQRRSEGERLVGSVGVVLQLGVARYDVREPGRRNRRSVTWSRDHRPHSGKVPAHAALRGAGRCIPTAPPAHVGSPRAAAHCRRVHGLSAGSGARWTRTAAVHTA